jgi:hypothetical protein
MFSRIRWLLVLWVLLGGGAVCAQETMLDLIPPDAAGAVAVRNLAELRKKGDAFAEAAKLHEFMRPSKLFDEGFRFLQVQGLVDESRPAAILLIHPRTVGLKRRIQLNDLFDLTVVALPFKDQNKMVKHFGGKPEQVQPGKVVPFMLPPGRNNNYGQFLFVRGKHLFLGNNAKALEHVAQSKPLTIDFPSARPNAIHKADLLIHLGGYNVWREEADESFLHHIRTTLGKSPDPAQRKLAEQLIQCSHNLRFLVGAVQLDDGLSLNLSAVFDPTKPAVKDFLGLLRRGQGGTNLRGLPEGNVVAAQASRGDGAATDLLARHFANELLSGPFYDYRLIADTERPLLLGLFNEVWRHLRGNRAALYLNRDERKQGLFSVVAILDTDDAPRFLTEMKTLARIADGSGLKLDPQHPEAVIDLGKLTADLGSPKYRVRELATLKLRLAGEAALPHLEKASKADDLEAATRAQQLYKDITALAAQRRKDLLSKDPLRRVRPTFAWIPRAEQRTGHTIDVIRLQLPKVEKEIQESLRQYLGPEWNNVRVAVHGKQVVVLVGSDVKLLEQTLTNLDQDKPGLAAAAALTKLFRPGNPSRKFELHGSMAKLLALTDPNAVPPAAGNQAPVVSSLGLTIEADRMQLDVWVPLSEVRVMANKTAGGGQ